MKKIFFLLVSMGALYGSETTVMSERDDQNDPGKPIMAHSIYVLDKQENKNLVEKAESLKKDVTFVAQVINYIHHSKEFCENTYKNVQVNPDSHAVAAVIGGLVGIFVTKRFLSLGRLHKKTDKILKIVEKSHSYSPVKEDSRKNVIIQ